MKRPENLDKFIAGWREDKLGLKPAFMEYLEFMEDIPDIKLDFKERPGISYSLRGGHKDGGGRDIFALVDVVDDEPDSRWLSVCFYADMIGDPDELGDFVPQGLLGEDARCFNLDEDDKGMRGYILDRIREAAASARK